MVSEIDHVGHIMLGLFTSKRHLFYLRLASVVCLADDSVLLERPHYNGSDELVSRAGPRSSNESHRRIDCNELQFSQSDIHSGPLHATNFLFLEKPGSHIRARLQQVRFLAHYVAYFRIAVGDVPALSGMRDD
eukprot:GEMP01084347.1.p2 GENE.GEMP01084347.1~~GEMP01084347.1.p2  ORF type:complete len:133 (+),score=3.67 GEMP01084347.1:271-669(+)